jgi:hypothetical protein
MRHARRKSAGGARSRPDGRQPGRTFAASHGSVLIVGGWAGLGVAHALVRSSNDPASGLTVLYSAGASVLSVCAVGTGVVGLNSAAMSPSRSVFHSGPAIRVALWLLVMAIAAATLLIRIDPFDGIATYGKPLSDLLVDLGAIVALLICLSGGVVALWNASQARRDEHSWNGQRK